MAAGRKLFPSVNGFSHGINNPPPEKISHRNFQPPSGIAHKAPGRNSGSGLISHKLNLSIFKTHHFSRHLPVLFLIVDHYDIPNAGPAAGGFHGHSYHIFNFSNMTDRLGLADQLRYLLIHMRLLYSYILQDILNVLNLCIYTYIYNLFWHLNNAVPLLFLVHNNKFYIIRQMRQLI